MCLKFIEFKYETSVMIYSLRSRSWKSVGNFPHDMPLGYSAKFFNGALHWAGDNDLVHDYSSNYTSGVVKVSFDWDITFMDLAMETYGEILQPEYDEGNDYNDLQLGSLRGLLCVLSNYYGIRADLWVMKVYGVTDSWTKLISVPYLTNPGSVRFSVPLCISNDGKVSLRLGWKLIVCDSKNNSFFEI
ncbi:putative F-box associated interaction domain-containing protein [Helianthus annuus]|nr:putative F-box associated interaction domain-containing protein [Helianthus annuus]